MSIQKQKQKQRILKYPNFELELNAGSNHVYITPVNRSDDDINQKHFSLNSADIKEIHGELIMWEEYQEEE